MVWQTGGISRQMVVKARGKKVNVKAAVQVRKQGGKGISGKKIVVSVTDRLLERFAHGNDERSDFDTLIRITII